MDDVVYGLYVQTSDGKWNLILATLDQRKMQRVEDFLRAEGLRVCQFGQKLDRILTRQLEETSEQEDAR